MVHSEGGGTSHQEAEPGLRPSEPSIIPELWLTGDPHPPPGAERKAAVEDHHTRLPGPHLAQGTELFHVRDARSFNQPRPSSAPLPQPFPGRVSPARSVAPKSSTCPSSTSPASPCPSCYLPATREVSGSPEQLVPLVFDGMLEFLASELQNLQHVTLSAPTLTVPQPSPSPSARGRTARALARGSTPSIPSSASSSPVSHVRHPLCPRLPCSRMLWVAVSSYSAALYCWSLLNDFSHLGRHARETRALICLSLLLHFTACISQGFCGLLIGMRAVKCM